MNSLWKDLLYLHGYLVRRDELAWQPDTGAEADRRQAGIKKAKAIASTCCVAAWPRIVGPR